MNKKFLNRVIQKLAQNSMQPVTLPPPPTVPAILSSYLSKAYNGPTSQAIKNMTALLNDAMHYSSKGSDSMQALVNNTSAQAAGPEQMHINAVAKMFYQTFLNLGQDFKAPVQAATIHQWADSILNSPDYSELAKINPTGPLASKVNNIKPRILDILNYIKQVNLVR